MTELVATSMGLFPLPDWAKRDLEDLKGHQKHDLISGDEDEAIVNIYEKARTELIERQQAAGIDLPVEGQLRWDDMLAHPLAVHDAVETHGIIRYYDNNNFYREPVVTDELTVDGDIATELSAVDTGPASLNAVVPGPYTLADLATDEYYGDWETFLGAVSEFLAGEIDAFPEVGTVTFAEPSLATNPPQGDQEPVRAAIDTVTTATEADTIVYPYWGVPPERTYATLLETGVDAVGFDLVTAPTAAGKLAAEHGVPDAIAAGVVDGQNTRVETPEEIHDRLDQFFETGASDPTTAYLLPNTGLFYLPMNRFGEKLDALGAATETTEVTA